MAKVLLISPDEGVRDELGPLLRARGHELNVWPRFGVLGYPWDAAFFDLSEQGPQGLATVAMARQADPGLRITVIDTGGDSPGLDRLATAVTLGAEEFMRKPIDRSDAEDLLDRLSL